MWSQRPVAAPISLTITPADPEPPGARPTLRRRGAFDGFASDPLDGLSVPFRAETRIQRVQLARFGIPTGSFKMNCVETPFLVDGDGRTFVDRLAISGVTLERRGTMERPPPAPAPVPTSSFNWVPFKQSRKPTAPNNNRRVRSQSLDISWPKKLGRAVIPRGNVDSGSSGALTRSQTVAVDLSDLASKAPIAPRPVTYRKRAAEPFYKKRDTGTSPRKPAQPKVTFEPKAQIHRPSISTSISTSSTTKSNSASNQPVRRKQHTKSRSLDTLTFKKPQLPSSKTVCANLNVLRADGTVCDLGFSPSNSLSGYSSSGSISKSLYQLTLSASTLKKKVLSTLSGYFALDTETPPPTTDSSDGAKDA